MALAITKAGANGAVLSRDQEDKLLDELFALQLAIVEGRKPQYQLSAATLKQLQSTVASAPKDTGIVEQVKPVHQSIPSLAYGTTATTSSGLDPIFLEKSDSLIRAEGRLKRQRIERELYDQVERRKHTFGERDGQTGALDVDNVLAKAQALMPPISGLRVAVPEARDNNSSFDENDYYSSQVESDWSASGVPVDAAAAAKSGQAFTGDYERFDDVVAGQPARKRQARAQKSTQSATKTTDQIPGAVDIAMYDNRPIGRAEVEDDYIPQDPAAGQDVDAYANLGQITAPENGEPSDYEPGEVSQISDDYTPEYAPQPVMETLPPQTRVAHNHLTQIAAPQPNRVSPLAVHKNQNYELELVNGRPEVVKKAHWRFDTDQARQSSASPPANSGNRAGKRQKSKKRKRELEQSARSKKRDRRSGLDKSAQYPQLAIKDEPRSPLPLPSFPEPQLPRLSQLPQPRYEYRIVEPVQAEIPPQFAVPPQHFGHSFSTVPAVPQRASSVMAQRVAPREEQDLRRVATLHHAQQPQAVEYRPYSPVAPYAAANRLQSGLMAPPQARLLENIAPSADPASSMPPPLVPHRVVVDQYGHKYYATELEPPVRASVAPENHLSQFERAPSRMAGVYAPTAQYDPANPRIEYLQPPIRTAATPAYTLDPSDGRMHKVRGHTGYAPQVTEARQYTMEPTSPVFERHMQYEQPHDVQGVFTEAHNGMPPPSFHYPDPTRQTMAPPPQMYSREGIALVQAAPRTYNVQPEFVQQMPMAFPPRQGSVAPVQYIRRSVQPEQSVRYVDARGYEVQPSQVRQISEYRQQY